MRTRRRTLAVATTALASTLLAAAPAAAFDPGLTTSPPRVIGTPADFSDALGQATGIFDHVANGIGTALDSKAVEEAAAEQRQRHQSPLLLPEQAAQEPTTASGELGENVEDVLNQTASLSESVAGTTESLVGNLDQVLKGIDK